MTMEPAETLQLPPGETPISFINPDGDVAPIICKEPGCTNHIEKPARGRTPLYCDEHKPTSHKAGAGSASRTTSNGGWAKAPEVERILTMLVNYASMGVTMLNAKDGSIIAEGGPEVVHQLIELGKTDRKIRKYLESIAAPGKYGPLLFALMGIAVPILANHNLIPKLNLSVDLSAGKES